MDYNWPGNVRELENAIERAVVLATTSTVPVSVLPEQVLHSTGVRTGGAPATGASLFEVVADFESARITEALEANNWSQTEAAAALKIPLSTLNQKIKRLGIQIRKDKK
jgi:DNA-binding NtrC family response regulator